MRIIAGEKRSRRLVTLEGSDTRPTADRVKEALFSILQPRLYGARVLDLYAGSGALALEALSRGADSAVLCDISPAACAVIRRNIEALEYGNRARLVSRGDSAAMALLEKEGASFDLIFLDPPYRMDMSPVCRRLCEGGLLKADGLIVAEHRKETPPRLGDWAVLRDKRTYGITGLSFLARPCGGEE